MPDALMDYEEFLATKKIVVQPDGFNDVAESEINPMLFDFQKAIVLWALKLGRAAIFADCGLGKSPMQLEWARHVHARTGGNVLIIAPLAVAKQTQREGVKFNVAVTVCRTQADVQPGVNICNYEMLEHFDPHSFVGVVLDESSILKSYTGKFRTKLISDFSNTRFRLACTATPAPNDFMELGNHSEFLGVMGREQMLAMFFYNDGSSTQKWNIKGHAEMRFWEWVASWAVYMRNPSDIGYDDSDFILPELRMNEIVVESDDPTPGMLFATQAQTLQERIRARAATVEKRAATCAETINASDEQWIVWCNLNSESDTLARIIPGSKAIKGSDQQDYKENTMRDFADGTIRVLITKPTIAGFGLNWQHCHNVAFVGLSDSWEQFYQAVRRCWRFGQEHPVNVNIIVAETEGAVLENIKRKEADSINMAKKMVLAMAEISRQNIKGEKKVETKYSETTETGDGWTLHLGDCVKRTDEIETDSIHFSVFSPPFASLYTYSDSERDMGNSTSQDDFFQHFTFLIQNLLRITMPGRNCSVHCMNLPTSKTKDGYIGIRDFRGDIIRAFVAAGWVYHSEVCIWKDPVVAMQRTKALGLLYRQLKKDSCMSRQGIADYLITFRKPGENAEPVWRRPESFPVSRWQKWASPVWMDIEQGDTLQKEREEKDEKHICPLQLGVIERAVTLWSNPGDVVLSPFAGIGSEGYQSILCGRRFLGIELKKSYFDQAVKNMRLAEQKARQQTHDLFSEVI